MDRTFTVKQVAKILGYSTNSIYTFLQAGRIKGIRVGKGRFRIPEEEIQSILKLSQKESSTLITQSIPVRTVVTPLRKVFDFRLDLMNLFDWFLGVGSILLGFSMFLYNKYNLLAPAINISVWLNTLQISLIAGGLGILISDILDKNIDENWRKFFRGILALAYIAVTAVSYYFADGGGIILFGLFSLVLVLSLLFGLGWIEAFLTLILLHSIAVPVTLIINLSSVELPDSINTILSLSTYSLWVWLFLSLMLGALLWWSHAKKWKLFWVLIIIYGSAYIYFSLELVKDLAWSQTFFLLLMGLTCITFPIWDSVFYFKRQGRNIIMTFFSVLLFIFLIIISVIWVMEQNIKEYAVKELDNKVVIGKILLEEILVKAKNSLIETSINPLIIESVKAGDKEKTLDYLKLIYHKEDDIRRIILLDNSGDLIGLYPHIKTTTENFAFRDYFIEAKRTKKLFFSDTFESKTEPKLIASTISMPILSEGEVIGVIAFGLDLSSIGNKLQTIANPENQEYFSVMDKNGSRVMHQSINLIGTRADPSNILFQFEGKNEGLGEGYNHKEIRTFQAFQTLQQSGWIVQIHAPVLQVLRPTMAVSRMLFYSIVFIFASIVTFILIVRRYVRV